MLHNYPPIRNAGPAACIFPSPNGTPSCHSFTVASNPSYSYPSKCRAFGFNQPAEPRSLSPDFTVFNRYCSSLPNEGTNTTILTVVVEVTVGW